MARRYRSSYRRRGRHRGKQDQRVVIAVCIAGFAAAAGGAHKAAPAVAHAVTSTPGTLTRAVTPSHVSLVLTSGQQQFAAELAAGTGLSYPVVAAWEAAEESGSYAQARQAAGNNDWLNIGYTDTATFGAGDSIWANPVTAARATAAWLKGGNSIPGYGTASSGVQAILSAAGHPAAAQIAAIQGSGWASSGYPDLGALYQQATG